MPVAPKTISEKTITWIVTDPSSSRRNPLSRARIHETKDRFLCPLSRTILSPLLGLRHPKSRSSREVPCRMSLLLGESMALEMMQKCVLNEAFTAAKWDSDYATIWRLGQHLQPHSVQNCATALGEALESLDPAPTGIGVFEVEDDSGRWEIGGVLSPSGRTRSDWRFWQRRMARKPFAVSRVEDIDWVAQVRRELHPVEAGRFTVYGGHDSHRVGEQP